MIRIGPTGRVSKGATNRILWGPGVFFKNKYFWEDWA